MRGPEIARLPLAFAPARAVLLQLLLDKDALWRFVKHFDKEGRPSATLEMAKQDRLENRRMLQDLPGLR